MMKRLMIVVLVIAAFASSESSATTNTNAVATSNLIDVVVLPEIEIRDAHAEDVLEFLASAAVRPIPPPPEGWSIGMNNPPPLEDSRPPILNKRHPAWKDMPSVTLALTNVTIRQTLDRVTKELGLTYEIAGSTIVLRTKNGQVLNRR